MNKPRNLSLTILAAAALSTLACSGGKVVVLPAAATPAASNLVSPAPGATVVATIPATPAVPEGIQQTPSPGPNYAWVAGYYNWLGDHYAWVPGSWVATPRATAVWVPAHWQQTTGGYTWTPGHWQ